MGFESRAISAWVTKQIVTIFSKTCDKWQLISCSTGIYAIICIVYRNLAFSCVHSHHARITEQFFTPE